MDRDRQGRDLFVHWHQTAGCSVAVDQLGNISARRAGLNPELPPVLLESRSETQPTGGKFDGAFGVLVGLEVDRTLNDHNLCTLRPPSTDDSPGNPSGVSGGSAAATRRTSVPRILRHACFAKGRNRKPG